MGTSPVNRLQLEDTRDTQMSYESGTQLRDICGHKMGQVSLTEVLQDMQQGIDMLQGWLGVREVVFFLKRHQLTGIGMPWRTGCCEQLHPGPSRMMRDAMDRPSTAAMAGMETHQRWGRDNGRLRENGWMWEEGIASQGTKKGMRWLNRLMDSGKTQKR